LPCLNIVKVLQSMSLDPSRIGGQLLTLCGQFGRRPHITL
jgi:hypothetical protein